MRREPRGELQAGRAALAAMERSLEGTANHHLDPGCV